MGLNPVRKAGEFSGKRKSSRFSYTNSISLVTRLSVNRIISGLAFHPMSSHFLLRLPLFKTWRPLALIPVVMGEEDPLHLSYPNRGQMVEDAPIAEVDQEGGVVLPLHVDVTRIRPQEEVGKPGLERH